jgi:hypothetical protein
VLIALADSVSCIARINQIIECGKLLYVTRLRQKPMGGYVNPNHCRGAASVGASAGSVNSKKNFWRKMDSLTVEYESFLRERWDSFQ